MDIPKINSENEEKLVRLIASGEAILLVGAGSSMILGYPSWGTLMDKLEEAVRADGDNTDFETAKAGETLLQFAKRLKEKLGSRYATAMVDIFKGIKRPNCDDCHVQLLQMPFRGIVTTNYDMVLENAWQQATKEMIIALNIDDETSPAEVSTFFQSLNHGYEGDKKIAHIHGLYTHVNSLVLCEEDYERKYGPPGSDIWTRHKRIMWALMTTRRIVYIGFSMTDPFIMALQKIVSDDFGLSGSATHFIISRFSTDREDKAKEQLQFANTIKTRYGIQTVHFPDTDKYEGLQSYIANLNQLVRTKNEEPVQAEIEVPTASATLPSAMNTEFVDLLRKKSLERNKKTREDDN